MATIMRYSDDELSKLLGGKESDLAERKETWKGDSPERGRQAVRAFANDLPDHRKPGVLFVGARDDGSPSGLASSDELLQALGSIKTDGKIVPPPTDTQPAEGQVPPFPACCLISAERWRARFVVHGSLQVQFWPRAWRSASARWRCSTKNWRSISRHSASRTPAVMSQR